jgi:hypothetical protein
VTRINSRAIAACVAASRWFEAAGFGSTVTVYSSVSVAAPLGSAKRGATANATASERRSNDELSMQVPMTIDVPYYSRRPTTPCREL